MSGRFEVDAHVHTFGVVIRKIFLERSFECWDRAHDTREALILECAIESLDVGIVVALPDSRVPVCHLRAQERVSESCRELWPVIGLYHLKYERRFLLGPCEKMRAGICAELL